MPHLIDAHIRAVRMRWAGYCAGGTFDQFVEFTMALNSLAEHLDHLRLPGLVRQCEGIENAAMSLFGDPSTHPIANQSQEVLAAKVEQLLNAIFSARKTATETERRFSRSRTAAGQPEWVKPRSVWMVTHQRAGCVHGLCEQLSFYGFRATILEWHAELPQQEAPFAIIFVPEEGKDYAMGLEMIRSARESCPASQIFYVGVPRRIDVMVDIMRAGVDITIQKDEQAAGLLSRILDLVQTREQESYRVLVVEDSKVAVTQIQRALDQHSIHSQVVTDPAGLIDAVDAYRPDLILMDMYMPHCNGVEATRALRQLPAYQAVPLVYLSSETDVGMQIEALRLGGDQFLTKPFNPVMLAATLKTKIERHRETQRTSQNDGLTGLLNHTASKARLNSMLATLPKDGLLCVAMIDIDRFKNINDSYGHPVGDQVIRSLAWLLKGRLRGTDLIGRYGGEEFIIALPDVPEHEAWVVLDRIRQDFSLLPHAHNTGSIRASFSAGIACFPAYRTASGLTNRADEALLRAKRYGRNRVVLAEDAQVAPEIAILQAGLSVPEAILQPAC